MVWKHRPSHNQQVPRTCGTCIPAALSVSGGMFQEKPLPPTLVDPPPTNELNDTHGRQGHRLLVLVILSFSASPFPLLFLLFSSNRLLVVPIAVGSLPFLFVLLSWPTGLRASFFSHCQLSFSLNRNSRPIHQRHQRRFPDQDRPRRRQSFTDTLPRHSFNTLQDRHCRLALPPILRSPTSFAQPSVDLTLLPPRYTISRARDHPPSFDTPSIYQRSYSESDHSTTKSTRPHIHTTIRHYDPRPTIQCFYHDTSPQPLRCWLPRPSPKSLPSANPSTRHVLPILPSAWTTHGPSIPLPKPGHGKPPSAPSTSIMKMAPPSPSTSKATPQPCAPSSTSSGAAPRSG